MRHISRAVVCALLVTSIAQGSAIITNGTVKLGVDDYGQLNIPGGVPSSVLGTTFVGLRYLPLGSGGPEAEATAHGCLCEGWGISANTGSGTISAMANNALGISGLTLNPFTSSATAATSDVSTTGGELQIVHDFQPSGATPNLYEVTVTVTNTSSSSLTDIVYRRNMDWDVEQTAFDEFTTIDTYPTAGGPLPSAVLTATNNGFASSDPTASGAAIGPFFCSGIFVDCGPADHGALFDFDLGNLAPGESLTFTIFYGAAGNEPDALTALGLVGAQFYSFGQPNLTPPPDHGEPNTFIFAFQGEVFGGCMEISEEEIICNPDDDSKVTFNFVVTNLSGVDAEYVLFTPQSPDSSMIMFTPNIIPISIPDGASQALSVTIMGIGGLTDLTGVEICFSVTLADEAIEECCSTEICITPDCDCLQLIETTVECVPGEVGKFTFTFQIVNLTGDVVEHIYFFPPPGVTILGDADNYVDVDTLPPGATSAPITVTICFDAGEPIPDKLVFPISIHDQFLGECCSQEICIFLPDCDATGGCCLPDGTCIETTAVECESLGGIYLGDDVPCDPAGCTPLLGACCIPGAGCVVLSALECEASGGVYLGDGVPCSPGICAPLTGACCRPDGGCITITAVECESIGGTYLGDGVPCDPTTCPLLGGCCLPDGTCVDVTALECEAMDGVYLGDGTLCDAGGCPPLPCPGDCDGDGAVGFGDLLLILSFWGPCEERCQSDLSGDGTVGFADLLLVLSLWGPCG